MKLNRAKIARVVAVAALAAVAVVAAAVTVVIAAAVAVMAAVEVAAIASPAGNLFLTPQLTRGRWRVQTVTGWFSPTPSRVDIVGPSLFSRAISLVLDLNHALA